MYRARILFLVAAVLPAACDTPGSPTSPSDLAPAASVSPSPQVYVLNTQLRGLTPDDGSPASVAYGHIQVKLQDNGDGTFTVDWKGRIFNPAREAFTAGHVGIIDPDCMPLQCEPPAGTGGPLPVVTFFQLDEADAVNCSVIDFDSNGIINPEILPAALANTWIVNPDVHEARFLSGEHLAVAGTFGAGTPEGSTGGTNEGGPRVRCAL